MWYLIAYILGFLTGTIGVALFIRLFSPELQLIHSRITAVEAALKGTPKA